MASPGMSYLQFVDAPLVLCIVAFFLFILYSRREIRPNLPPGPWGFPLVGVLPFLGSDPQLRLMKWTKEYGNVYTVKMGVTTTVILNGYEAVRDVFQRKGALSSGRPHIPTFAFLEGRGILCEDYGVKQRMQREFVMKYLSQINLDKYIEDEILALFQYTEGQNGEPFYFDSLGIAAMANIIGAILFDSRHCYDDPDFRKLIESYNIASKASGQASIQNFLPFLWFLPQCKKGKHAWETFAGSFNLLYDAHKKGFRPGETRGLIDAWGHHFSIQNQDGQPVMYEKDLKATCQTLYFTGSETTAVTMAWGMLYLLSNPDVCNKVQTELDDVVGRDRRPNLGDRPCLPFTCATLMEIQRCHYIAPLSAPHKATNDMTWRGHCIPKGTQIMANYWSIFMNDDLWPNPGEFRPGRFLDERGMVAKFESFIPFSVGKRSCPGELLVRHELFLVISALLQKFTFHVPEGESLPDMKGVTGSVYMPPKFRVYAKLRF